MCSGAALTAKQYPDRLGICELILKVCEFVPSVCCTCNAAGWSAYANVVTMVWYGNTIVWAGKEDAFFMYIYIFAFVLRHSTLFLVRHMYAAFRTNCVAV